MPLFSIKTISRIPRPVKQIIKFFYYLPFDIFHKIRNKDTLVPPRYLVFDGGRHFRETGDEFMQYFINLGNLQKNHSVLDVGCGIGRMAIPLTTFLSQSGEYFGFDIGLKEITWCQKHITKNFPNFHFTHCDIYNKHYNPNGQTNAMHYSFPYSDAHFDFVLLTSVFTHMFPSDMQNYFSEISRVLKPNGTCLISFFLINEQSKRMINSGISSLNFIHKVGYYFTVSIENPESAIAFKEQFIRRTYAKYGLYINEPIHFGSWPGRTDYLSFQDIIVATKRQD